MLMMASRHQPQHLFKLTMDKILTILFYDMKKY